jgi:hypothetical protein
VASWARALRAVGSRLRGRSFVLPPLEEVEHVVVAEQLAEGMLFALPAVGLQEQREEQRRTMTERCERSRRWSPTPAARARLVPSERRRRSPRAPHPRRRAGERRDSDEEKEEKLLAFARGEARVLGHEAEDRRVGPELPALRARHAFPSHSFEQYYQCVRRCWRFGQTRPVRVDMVATEGERGDHGQPAAESAAATRMFDALVAHMHRATHDRPRAVRAAVATEVPSWL